MSRHHAALDRRRWARVRREALDRDGWRCRTCGAYANEVDHIVPLARGGAPYDLANLQSLCRTHHAAKSWTETGRRPLTAAERAWRALVAELSGGA